MTRGRGSALGHVLITIAVLTVFSVSWRVAFRSAHQHGVRAAARAQAQAAAESAWARARLKLARGEDPACARGPVPGGEARVRSVPGDGGLELEVTAWAPRLDGLEHVAHQVRLTVSVGEGEVRVLARREGGR